MSFFALMNNSEDFQHGCRMGCGACCIAISISSPMPGYPNGKPAGERCMHLNSDYSCTIYNNSDKPKVCTDFKYDELVCGASREDAMRILNELEG